MEGRSIADFIEAKVNRPVEREESPLVGKACARLSSNEMGKLDIMAKAAGMSRNGFFEDLAPLAIEEAWEHFLSEHDPAEAPMFEQELAELVYERDGRRL